MPYRIERGSRLNCAGTPKDDPHPDFSKGDYLYTEEDPLSLIESRPPAKWWGPLFLFVCFVLLVAAIYFLHGDIVAIIQRIGD